MKILVTTSSFGEECGDLIEDMQRRGISLIPNPHKKTLDESQTLSLVKEHRPTGIIAGTGPFKETVLRAGAPELKVVSRVGTGWDNVDRDLANQLGIQVFRTPDSVTQPVVELTVGLILDLSRRISFQDRLVRSGRWEKYLGSLLKDKVLGLVGCGRIGKGVALTMKSLGMQVQAYDPFPQKEWHADHGVPLVGDIPSLFATSDVVSLHAEFSETLRNFVNRELLHHAKRGLLLINVARGSMIDHQALGDALKDGTLGGAALDVFDKEPYSGPLTQLENVVLTPHIGSHTKESRILMEREALANIYSALGTK